MTRAQIGIMAELSQSSGEEQSPPYSPSWGRYCNSDDNVQRYTDRKGKTIEEWRLRWYNSADDDDRDSYEEPYRRERKKQKLPEEDRISTMPDQILHHILSFLPTIDSVNTGTLSRRWQYLWTTVPNLYFIQCRDSHRSNFVTFVNQTLILHRCCIKKFVLDFVYKLSDDSDVDLWIRFATRANVEELCLDFPQNYDDYCSNYVLPQHIYSNSSLTKLNLSSCNVWPTGSIDWKFIKSLKIRGTRLSESVLQNILLGSPVLEVLELYEISSINRMNICSASLRKLVISGYEDVTECVGLDIIAPNVQSLELSGMVLLPKCRLRNVGSLIECNLSFKSYGLGVDVDGSEEHQNMVKELFDGIPYVEKLTLGAWCIENLSKLEAKRSFGLWSSRKCLMLDMCIQEIDLPRIACLLEHSPQLETLIINMNSPCSQVYHDFKGEHYWTSLQRNMNCLQWHLKTVKIIGFRAGVSDECEGVISLAQFLLMSARVLEKMVVKVPRIGSGHLQEVRDLQNLYQVTQKLLSIPRISRQAVVLFSE